MATGTAETDTKKVQRSQGNDEEYLEIRFVDGNLPLDERWPGKLNPEIAESNGRAAATLSTFMQLGTSITGVIDGRYTEK